MRTKRIAANPTSAKSKLSPPDPAGVVNDSFGTPTSAASGVVLGISGDGLPGWLAFANTGYTPAHPA